MRRGAETYSPKLWKYPMIYKGPILRGLIIKNRSDKSATKTWCAY